MKLNLECLFVCIIAAYEVIIIKLGKLLLFSLPLSLSLISLRSSLLFSFFHLISHGVSVYTFVTLQEGLCESRDKYIGRGNALNVDLNRDFPDRFETPHDRRAKAQQPETVAMMRFITQNPFVLSANFHGGAVVRPFLFRRPIPFICI